MKAIETEHQHYFITDEEGNLIINDGIDLAVAIDILEHPARYMPSANQELRSRRYVPGQNFAPRIGNSTYPAMPQMACAAATVPSYGGQPQGQTPWNFQMNQQMMPPTVTGMGQVHPTTYPPQLDYGQGGLVQGKMFDPMPNGQFGSATPTEYVPPAADLQTNVQNAEQRQADLYRAQTEQLKQEE